MTTAPADLEKRVRAIERRNRRVEVDKAWESSWTRKLSIAILTYVTVASYLRVIHNDKPFVNALVPVVGFILSTLVLPGVRSIWQKYKQQ